MLQHLPVCTTRGILVANSFHWCHLLSMHCKGASSDETLPEGGQCCRGWRGVAGRSVETPPTSVSFSMGGPLHSSSSQAQWASAALSAVTMAPAGTATVILLEVTEKAAFKVKCFGPISCLCRLLCCTNVGAAWTHCTSCNIPFCMLPSTSIEHVEECKSWHPHCLHSCSCL